MATLHHPIPVKGITSGIGSVRQGRRLLHIRNGLGAKAFSTQTVDSAAVPTFQDPKTACEHQRTDELLRALVVLGLCSFSPFVRHSAHLLAGPGAPAAAPSAPQLSAPPPPALPPALQQWLHESLFRHFCAGESPTDVLTLMDRLHAYNVGAILDFAEEYEAEEPDPDHHAERADTEKDPKAGRSPSSPRADAPASASSFASAAAASRHFHHGAAPSPRDSDVSPNPDHSGTPALEAAHSDDSLRTMPLHAYSSEAVCERRLAALLAAVDIAAALPGPRPGFTALKLPALGDARLLGRLSVGLEEVAALFRAVDGDGDGLVSQAEFEVCYERLAEGAEAQGDSGTLITLELSRLFSEDEAGRVDYVAWLQRLDLRTLMSLAAGLREREAATRGAAAPEPGEWRLSGAEQRRLQAMFGRLERLVERAVAKGVKLMIDAEHGPLRPAVEHITHTLMRRHNRTRRAGSASLPGSAATSGGAGGDAAVLATYQAYLRDTPQRLAAELERAERQGYTLGAKLVCGAYLPLEQRYAADAGLPAPTWDSAAQTHAAFDACVGLLLGGVTRGSAELLVASHSPQRVGAALAGMAAAGLDPRVAPVYFAQLLGMADGLSFELASDGYKVYKFCPYGEEARVRPYLVRRVHETQRALQAGRQDLRLVQQELWRRLSHLIFGPGAPGSPASAQRVSPKVEDAGHSRPATA